MFGVVLNTLIMAADGQLRHCYCIMLFLYAGNLIRVSVYHTAQGISDIWNGTLIEPNSFVLFGGKQGCHTLLNNQI